MAIRSRLGEYLRARRDLVWPDEVGIGAVPAGLVPTRGDPAAAAGADRPGARR